MVAEQQKAPPLRTPSLAKSTLNLPSPVGPYSPGIAVGNLVFVSGQAGRDPATGQIAADVETQTEQTLKNIAAILEAAGSSLSHVVRCGVFLVDIADDPEEAIPFFRRAIELGAGESAREGLREALAQTEPSEP